jgi:hypothetical protein
MGLRSGGNSVAAVGSCVGGGVGGHTSDSVSGETRLASLAPFHDVRVPVG